MTEKPAIDQTRIRTVVLVGRQDFGRCPLAGHLPVALWPVGGVPMLERLLRHLADEGIRSAALCCDAAVSSLIGTVPVDNRLSVRLVIEELSSGTAGCLRDAVAADPGDLIVVLSGSMTCPPSIRHLIETHLAGNADLTVVFNPDPSGESSHGASAEIYLCRPDVLKLVPAGGYCDIKEGLIPALLRAGGTIVPAVLPQDVGNFHDMAGYLDATSLYLEQDAAGADGYTICERSAERVTAAGADIDPEARIYGPVAVAAGAKLDKGAVIIGPAVLDRGVHVGRDSTVVASVLWDGCKVGTGCELRGTVVERDAVVPDGTVVAERAVPAAGWDAAYGRIGRKRKASGRALVAGPRSSFLHGLVERLVDRGPLSRPQAIWALAGLIVGAFVWSYWPILADLWKVWQRSDEYSAGMLVPPLAVYVLWSRRRDLASVPIKPAMLCGTAIFLFAQYVRYQGLYRMYGFAERLSVMLSIVALVVLVLGWPILRRVVTTVLFLCLMLPWPHRIQSQISLPLQDWATDSAVYCLELVGYDVARDGNVIGIGTTNVAVAEACNGLRMVTAFLVISALVVMLVNRPWWEKLVILASSLPIALLCNTLRLAVTAVAFTIIKGQNIEKLFHDFGGYAMMPLALAMVVGEFWLLGRLFTPGAEVKPAVIARRRPEHAVDS